MSFWNQIFWLIEDLKRGDKITPEQIKIDDQYLSKPIALKRAFLETYGVIELMSQRNMLTPEFLADVNWLRDRINEIFLKMLNYTTFTNDGKDYKVSLEFSYKPVSATIERMERVLTEMFNSWLGVRKHERAAALWNGCLLMGLYLEKESRALSRLIDYQGFKAELERVFVSQRYLE